MVALAGASSLSAFMIDDAAGETPALECTRPSDTARAFRIERESHVDVVLLDASGECASIRAFGCALDGRGAWLRVPRAQAPQLRWLDGNAFESSAFGVRQRLRDDAAKDRS
jgi:hypothetical protein